MMTKKDSNEALDVLRLDFCTKYLETLPKRTQFIQNLRAIQVDSEFDQNCLQAMHQQSSGFNEWFDPIDPMQAISQHEICQVHKKLFGSLK